LRFQPIKAASSLPYTFRIGFNAKNAKIFAKFTKTLPRILPLCVLCGLRLASFAFSAGRILVTLCTLRVGSKTKNATIFAKTAKNPPKTPAKLKLSKTKVNLVDHNKDIYPSSPLEAQTAQNAQNPQNAQIDTKCTNCTVSTRPGSVFGRRAGKLRFPDMPTKNPGGLATDGIFFRPRRSRVSPLGGIELAGASPECNADGLAHPDEKRS